MGWTAAAAASLAVCAANRSNSPRSRLEVLVPRHIFHPRPHRTQKVSSRFGHAPPSRPPYHTAQPRRRCVQNSSFPLIPLPWKTTRQGFEAHAALGQCTHPACEPATGCTVRHWQCPARLPESVRGALGGAERAVAVGLAATVDRAPCACAGGLQQIDCPALPTPRCRAARCARARPIAPATTSIGASRRAGNPNRTELGPSPIRTGARGEVGGFASGALVVGRCR
ncbi:hypothetical protein C8R47DRAFT_36531 [Mycena vitilis]|nr:hypothetical protein C8R47DRAFT_36531 [Mycena vitilis]